MGDRNIREYIPVNYKNDPELIPGVITSYKDIAVGVGVFLFVLVIVNTLFISNSESLGLKFFWLCIAIIPGGLAAVTIGEASLYERVILKLNSRKNEEYMELSYEDVSKRFTYYNEDNQEDDNYQEINDPYSNNYDDDYPNNHHSNDPYARDSYYGNDYEEDVNPGYTPTIEELEEKERENDIFNRY